MDGMIVFFKEVGIPLAAVIVMAMSLYRLANANASISIIKAEMLQGQSETKREGETLAYQISRETRLELKEINTQLNTVERDYTKLQAEFNALQAAFTALQGTATALQATIDKQDIELKALKEQVAELERQNAERQTTINNLLLQITELKLPKTGPTTEAALVPPVTLEPPTDTPVVQIAA